jgi:hypothetical protein
LVDSKIIDSAREYISGYNDQSALAHLGFDDNQEDLKSIGVVKENIITMLTSLLEGELNMDIVDRMTKSLDFQVLRQRVAEIFYDFAMDQLGEDKVDLHDHEAYQKSYDAIPLAKL